MIVEIVLYFFKVFMNSKLLKLYICVEAYFKSVVNDKDQIFMTSKLFKFNIMRGRIIQIGGEC